MECHHWISVWAWADKLARLKTRAVKESWSFMVVPESERTENGKLLNI
jgi:hypothetical protein